MKIDRKKLYRLYMKDVNQIAKECDWVSTFGPKAIVGLISDILERHPELMIKENEKIS